MLGMGRTLKVSVERKTFWVSFEGGIGGRWCSITEHSKGFAFVLGFEKEEVSWLIEQLTKAIELKVCMGFNRKFRGKNSVHLLEGMELLKEALYSMLVVPSSGFDEKGRQSREGRNLHKFAGPLQRSFANVVSEERPRRGGLVSVGRWARAVVCECQVDSVKWDEVGRALARRLGHKGVVTVIRQRKSIVFCRNLRGGCNTTRVKVHQDERRKYSLVEKMVAKGKL
ncbi:hypothetical protein CK203_050346 [Vitis vinifera]|uniref:Uncharacterized protein n=1 Tax=Vitis vinifera TaxID=29760 RepID=A0A438GZU1_VITVI|nr:hypothetical protein CK203_050346 [Vitis vinifera]